MPGNIAELRPLIVICGFVGFFCLITMFAVSETPTFFSGDQTSGTSPISSETVPNPLGIMSWNESYVLNFTATVMDFKLGDWNIEVAKHSTPNRISMETYDYKWIFRWNIEYFSWLKDGKDITYTGGPEKKAILMSKLDEYGTPVSLKAQHSKTQFDVTFSYNSSEYSNYYDAWVGGGLKMIFNLDWNERNTGFNALSFIAGLFLFSLPGVPVIVNGIIWVMIFPPLAYLAFIVVLKIIGSAFGGG